MEQRFKSKISSPILLLTEGILLAILGILSFEKPHWIGAVLLVPVMIFVAYVFYSISYTVVANQLIVRVGFFYKKEIPIDKILKIQETRNPISAPAPSLDRLEISYRLADSIIISPLEKKEFLDLIKKLNPEVKIILKEK